VRFRNSRLNRIAAIPNAFSCIKCMLKIEELTARYGIAVCESSYRTAGKFLPIPRVDPLDPMVLWQQ
jgi:hypothetical protein